ncbi:MAG TPA: RNA polymerase sporulation sigma factor SigK [Firmicutes bacterium]|jgi:RNA polymerase sporulation-specific sigma factor|nr:RNA polymerase sporulation sigma factor SigK [Bacillota bacterium]HBR29793.1 RNA polymerase sporulation sigma factor SigK [Bacillota bacterium]HBR33404.1 RNA polymerase sporulation sigma factor SigK [Bacillota bacterium]
MILSVVGMLLNLIYQQFAWLFSYISNNNVFPMPLSEEEERALILQMEEGDKTARNTLIERNLRLVAHIVKKFDNTGEDNDDLISIGTIGLIKGINTYQRKYNTRLATYAARCIENEILMHLRSTKKLKNDLFLQDPIGADKEGNEITLLDILDTGTDLVPDLVESKLEEEALRRKLGILSKREKKVIELRYGLKDGLSKTQREIAKILGISRSYVSRIEKKALKKLFKDFSGGEEENN